MAEELDSLRRLAGLVGPAPEGQVWIGDDAAVVPGPGDDDSLVAADVVVDGVHFDLSLAGLADVAWKAVAVNVSDIAAMAGTPRFILATVAAPSGTDLDLLLSELVTAARAHGAELVGGDLSSAPVVSVSVTVLGVVPRGQAVLRSGARAGDAVFVTGPVGGAAAGLELLRSGDRESFPALVAAHLRPTARVPEGLAAAAAGATAMIDVSDGLAVDAWRIVDASGCTIDLESVPVAADVGAVLADAEAAALGGGDDYQLVFTAPDPAAVSSVFEQRGLAAPVRIGTCRPGAAALTLRGDPARPAGWRHGW